MADKDFVDPRDEAIEQFNQRGNRDDGKSVTDNLTTGLVLLRESLYLRVHHDVERTIGKDSMLMPISEMKTELATKTEVEHYEIAESAAAVEHFGYLGAEHAWYGEWLTRLRLGQLEIDSGHPGRLTDYSSLSQGDRLLAFTDVLAKVLPEARRAPLVLFRLFPLCVQLVTALAFGDESSASELRRQQGDLLPAIRDCRECHGKVLDNGEQCRKCGNPLWKTEWLVTAD